MYERHDPEHGDPYPLKHVVLEPEPLVLVLGLADFGLVVLLIFAMLL